MTNTLDQLDALAREATPGPWQMNNCHTGANCWCACVGTAGHGEEGEDAVSSYGSLSRKNAAYIAALNPATWREISARLRKAQAALEFAHMTIEHALALDYLGEGSTKGMAMDAASRLDQAIAALNAPLPGVDG
jgi:hypothetical protein